MQSGPEACATYFSKAALGKGRLGLGKARLNRVNTHGRARQLDQETRAFPWLGFYLNGTLVSLDDLVDDGKAQPRPIGES